VNLLLDTNILSELLRRPAGLVHRLVQHSGRLYTSSISLAELYEWANGRNDPAPTLAAIQSLLTHEVSVIFFDNECAEDFGRLRVDLRRQGICVDNMDRLIATTARVYDPTMVTHNTRHFQDIPGLRLEDWLAP
jgi:tRNA(fMet)-specific endonuclease VapC